MRWGAGVGEQGWGGTGVGERNRRVRKGTGVEGEEQI